MAHKTHDKWEPRLFKEKLCVPICHVYVAMIFAAMKASQISSNSVVTVWTKLALEGYMALW